MLTAKAMPEMDNDQVKHAAAELDTWGDARGDVEKGSPGALAGSDSVPAERRIMSSHCAERSPVWMGLEDREGIGEILLPTSPLLPLLALVSFPSSLYRYFDGL